MEELIGSSPGDFIFVTIVLAGAGAYLTGQTQAESWHGWRHLIPFVLLLVFASRFLHYALFDGVFLAPVGAVIDLVWVSLLMAFGYATTRASKMVRQYPWMYERAGPFGWRDRIGG